MITDKQLTLWSTYNPNGTMPRQVTDLAREVLELRAEIRRLRSYQRPPQEITP